jgi:hypothetical protein
MQPDLGVLRAERNLIDNFYGAERCPKLKEVRTSAPPTAPLCNARTCAVTMQTGVFGWQSHRAESTLQHHGVLESQSKSQCVPIFLPVGLARRVGRAWLGFAGSLVMSKSSLTSFFDRGWSLLCHVSASSSALESSSLRTHDDCDVD